MKKPKFTVLLSYAYESNAALDTAMNECNESFEQSGGVDCMNIYDDKHKLVAQSQWINNYDEKGKSETPIFYWEEKLEERKWYKRTYLRQLFTVGVDATETVYFGCFVVNKEYCHENSETYRERFFRFREWSFE